MARSWRDLDECTYYWTLTETKRGSDSASAYWGKYKILSSDHRVLGAETDKVQKQTRRHLTRCVWSGRWKREGLRLAIIL